MFKIKIIGLFLLIVLTACTDDSNSPDIDNITSKIISFSDCKEFHPVKDTVTAGFTCAENNWDGTGTLMITRENAAFNCAIQRMNVGVTLRDSMIFIDETGVIGYADCECLYDYQIKINNLKLGTYYVKVIENAYLGNDSPLSYKLTLGDTNYLSSACCDRTHYPWF